MVGLRGRGRLKRSGGGRAIGGMGGGAGRAEPDGTIAADFAAATRQAVAMTIRCPPAATVPITEDDATIEAFLRSAHAPTLMAVLAHLTGATDMLHGAIRPRNLKVFGDEQGGITPDERETIVRMVSEQLRGYRDRGSPPLPALPAAAIRQIMDFMGDAPLSDDYAELFAEEMGFVDPVTRGLALAPAPGDGRREQFSVAIIGAGLSGVLAAIRLQQAGVDYVVIEKNAGIGGTWFENQYPGCRADTANEVYSYSFDIAQPWREYFAQQQDMHDYIAASADRQGVAPHIRFSTEMVSAQWVEEQALWRITVRDAGGREDRICVNALISATGQLNRPKLPDIPGRESFAGVAFHAAQWQHGHDFTGKKIAVIGSGATAYQLAPELARDAAEMLVFQRSATWVFPTPNYHDAQSPAHRWLHRKVPFYANWHRFWIRVTTIDKLMPLFEVDRDWPDHARSVNAANEQMRRRLTDYLRAQWEGDDEMFAKVVPDYPVGGRRILRDCGQWAGMFKRGNARLITDPIVAITPEGLATGDGTLHRVDAILYATGFDAARFLGSVRITGRNGILLEEQWDGDEARAYLGTVVPNFPNFFLLYGPNTNAQQGGSVIFTSECQVRYVMGCLKLLIEGSDAAMDCRHDVHDAYNAEVDRVSDLRVWGLPQVRSWVKNSKGRVTQNWPFQLIEFWRRTKRPDPADFNWTHGASGTATSLRSGQ